jgi:hypothetical protein
VYTTAESRRFVLTVTMRGQIHSLQRIIRVLVESVFIF